MVKLVYILVLNIWIFKNAEAICNQCNLNNGIACISDTKFNLCFNGMPSTSRTYSCLNANEICTNHAQICMDSTLTSGLVPGCGDTSNCGKCETLNDGAWSCTSRTTFTMCLNKNLTDIRDACPPNYMCDMTTAAKGVYPCVPECNAPTITYCDLNEAIDAPTTTTQAPTTTLTTEEITTTNVETTTMIFSPTQLSTTTTEAATTTTPTLPSTSSTAPANLVCSQQNAVGRYSYPNDATCRQYVYCYLRRGIMQTTFLNCPGSLYFNPATSMCDAVIPAGCT